MQTIQIISGKERNNGRSDNWDRWWINLSSLLFGSDPYGTNRRSTQIQDIYKTFLTHRRTFLVFLPRRWAEVVVGGSTYIWPENLWKRKRQNWTVVAKRTENLDEINFTPSTTLSPYLNSRAFARPASISQQNLWSLMENLFPFINLFFPASHRSSRHPWLRLRQIRH